MLKPDILFRIFEVSGEKTTTEIYIPIQILLIHKVFITKEIAITTIGNSPKNDFYNQICF